MKLRLIISIVFAVVLAIAARAQNNPYAIDDVCYEYFKLAERLVDDTSNDAFDMANDALLKRANEVGDDKARTLYAVGRLKRACRIARTMDNQQDANELVERRRKELMDLSRETGYMQYFYYGYELTQNYYVNTKQQVHAHTLLMDMMETAAKDNNEYGLWQSHRYIAALFKHQNDLLNARKYLRNVINIYENTSDDNILRQSISRHCCDMADTYLTGSDSARYYCNKAEETAVLHADSVRFTFYKAQLAALDRRINDYHRYRDYCLADESFPTSQVGGDRLFACADAIIADKSLDEISAIAADVKVRQQMVYLRELAIKYKREDVAAWIGTNIILTLYSDISALNDLKMEEISAGMTNSQLAVALEAGERRIRLLRIAVAVLAAALVAALAALIISHRRNNTQNRQ